MNLTASGLAAERGGRRLFEGLSFSLAAGEVMVVTGPNGAGKSTLLRILAGLLDAAAGKVALDPAPEAGIGAATHYVGHLDALKPALSVADNLRFWRRVLGGGGDVDGAIDEVGLGALAGLPVATLSAGQRRRAALARLIVAHRPVWLLDEPTGALDVSAEAMLGRLITRHLKAGGLIVAATHRPLPVSAASRITLGGPA